MDEAHFVWIKNETVFLNLTAISQIEFTSTGSALITFRESHTTPSIELEAEEAKALEALLKKQFKLGLAPVAGGPRSRVIT